MGFESFPSIKKEQGPDKAMVESFVIPISRFVEGDPQAIEVLRGKTGRKEREALKAAVAQVRQKLNERYKPVVGMNPNSAAEAGLSEKVVKLQQLEDQLAFAA